MILIDRSRRLEEMMKAEGLSDQEVNLQIHSPRISLFSKFLEIGKTAFTCGERNGISSFKTSKNDSR